MNGTVGPPEKSADDVMKSSVEEGVQAMLKVSKMCNEFPLGKVRENIVSSHPRFSSIVESQEHKILDIISGILQSEGIRINVRGLTQEEQLDLIVDGNDRILDRAKIHLDELNGIRCNPGEKSTGIGSWNRKLNESVIWKGKSVTSLSNNDSRVDFGSWKKEDIPKPQLDFVRKVDNSSEPFKPPITYKPNSLVPLDLKLVDNIDGTKSYAHPYEYELEMFRVPARQLDAIEPVLPLPLEEAAFSFVDNIRGLSEMINELRSQPEIAVDLEHHSYHSFQGFTCLVQISSRQKDYVVDALKLRDELHRLNEVFTDPAILKVFHDARCDIQWLQKDFGVYVVNMFDTYQAATVLNYQQLGLSYLLKKFCDFDAVKCFQLFDWRIRPLPDAAVSYARADTHFLLYVYDSLRNSLLESANLEIQNNALAVVYSKSLERCKARYEKYDGNIEFSSDKLILLAKKKNFNNRQRYAFNELFKWRDLIARQEDESTGFVLPNHMLLQISTQLPREMQGILACCNPVPSLVSKHLAHLHQIIHTARAQQFTQPIVEAIVTSDHDNRLSKFSCPHDKKQVADFHRDNLVTHSSIDSHVDIEIKLPKITAFRNESTNRKVSTLANEKIKRITAQQASFVTPYERYKRTLIYERNKEIENERLNRKRKSDSPVVISDTNEEPKKVKFTPRGNAKDPTMASVKVESCSSQPQPLSNHFQKPAYKSEESNPSDEDFIEKKKSKKKKKKNKELKEKKSLRAKMKGTKILPENILTNNATLDERDIPFITGNMDNEMGSDKAIKCEPVEPATTNSTKPNEIKTKDEKVPDKVTKKNKRRVFEPFTYSAAAYSKLLTKTQRNFAKKLAKLPKQRGKKGKKK